MKRRPVTFVQVTNPVEWPRVYKSALAAWERLARVMRDSPTQTDRDAANQIEDFVTGREPTIPKKR